MNCYYCGIDETGRGSNGRHDGFHGDHGFHGLAVLILGLNSVKIHRIHRFDWHKIDGFDGFHKMTENRYEDFSKREREFSGVDTLKIDHLNIRKWLNLPIRDSKFFIIQIILFLDWLFQSKFSIKFKILNVQTPEWIYKKKVLDRKLKSKKQLQAVWKETFYELTCESGLYVYWQLPEPQPYEK